MLTAEDTFQLTQDCQQCSRIIMTSCILEMGVNAITRKLFKESQGALLNSISIFLGGQRAQVVRRFNYIDFLLIFDGQGKEEFQEFESLFKTTRFVSFQIPECLGEDENLKVHYETMNNLICKCQALIAFIREKREVEIGYSLKCRIEDEKVNRAEGGKQVEIPSNLKLFFVYHIAIAAKFRVEYKHLPKKSVKNDKNARFKIWLNKRGVPMSQDSLLDCFRGFQKQVNPKFKLDFMDSRRNLVSLIKHKLVERNVS
jgi:hypothetical protein